MKGERLPKSLSKLAEMPGSRGRDHRKDWPSCTGIGGRVAPAILAKICRNTHHLRLDHLLALAQVVGIKVFAVEVIEQADIESDATVVSHKVSRSEGEPRTLLDEVAAKHRRSPQWG